MWSQTSKLFASDGAKNDEFDLSSPSLFRRSLWVPIWMTTRVATAVPLTSLVGTAPHGRRSQILLLPMGPQVTSLATALPSQV